MGLITVDYQPHVDGAIGFASLQLQQARAQLVVTRQINLPALLFETRGAPLRICFRYSAYITSWLAPQPIAQARNRDRAAQHLGNQGVGVWRCLGFSVASSQDGLARPYLYPRQSAAQRVGQIQPPHLPGIPPRKAALHGIRLAVTILDMDCKAAGPLEGSLDLSLHGGRRRARYQTQHSGSGQQARGLPHPRNTANHGRTPKRSSVRTKVGLSGSLARASRQMRNASVRRPTVHRTSPK